MNELHRFVMIMIAVLLAVSIGSCQNGLDESGDTGSLPEDVIKEYIADGFVPMDWGQAELEEFDKETGKVVMSMVEEDIPAFEFSRRDPHSISSAFNIPFCVITASSGTSCASSRTPRTYLHA